MNTNVSKVNFYDELSKNPDFMTDFFGEFKINSLIKEFLFKKRSGYPTNFLFLIMTLLPFKEKNLFEYCKSAENNIKDQTAFYNFLNSPRNSWRDFIINLAKKFIDYIDYMYNVNNIRPTKKNKLLFNKKILAFDESNMHKDYSKKVDFFGWLFDKKEDSNYFGYAITPLLCIYRGVDFVIDFIFKSNTKDDNILIDQNDSKIIGTPSIERREECFKEIPETIIKLIDNVISNGIIPDYAVADSWYDTCLFIEYFINRKIPFITRLKNNDTKYVYNKKVCELKDIYETLSPNTCSKFNKEIDILGYRTIYFDLNKNKKDSKENLVPLKVVFTALHNDHSQWAAFISTDPSLKVKTILSIYESRWNIEVYFKVIKQTLKIKDQYQGRNFDGYISILSISIVQTYLMTFFNLNKKYKTSNEAFKRMCREIKYFHHDKLALIEWNDNFELLEQNFKNDVITEETFNKKLINIKLSINSAVDEERSEIMESIQLKNLVNKLDKYLRKCSAA